MKNTTGFLTAFTKSLLVIGTVYSTGLFAQQQSVVIPLTSAVEVNSSSPNTNYWGDGEQVMHAKTGTISGSLYTERTYFRIDLSQLPSDAIIHSAVLSLQGYYHNTDGEYTASIFYPAENWSTENITWNEQPEIRPEDFVLIPDVSEENENVMVDMTGHIRNLMYFPSSYTDFGYCLRLTGEQAYREYGFYAPNIEDAELRPTVQILYEVPVDLEYNFATTPIRCDDPQGGSATINITQGNYPYSYSWSNGTSIIGTSKTISGVSPGQYQLTVTDNIGRNFGFEVSVGYDPNWQDDHSVYFTAYRNMIEKQNEHYGWSIAAGSGNILHAGEDGWIEYTVKDLKDRMIGFANAADFKNGYTKILGGLYIRYNRDLRRLVSSSQLSLGSYDEGDIVRIEKVGTTFSYYLNGEFLSSTTNSAIAGMDLVASVCMWHPNYRFEFVRTSFGPGLNLRLYAEDVVKTGNNGEIYALVDCGTPPYSYTWSNGGTKDRIKDLAPGSYTVTVTDANALVAIASASIVPDPNSSMNWKSSKIFDEGGNFLGASKTFMDYNGKSLQSLGISSRTLNVSASQQIYDYYGRPALSTLSAPTFQKKLSFKQNFVKATDNTIYNYTHFDIPNYTGSSSALTLGEVDLPYKLDTAQKGGLGWYYSNNNAVEAYQDRTNFPYSRIEYAKFDPGQTVRGSAPNDRFRMGSGNETKSYQLPVAGEFVYMFGYGSSWEVGRNYSILPNVDGTGIGYMYTDRLKYEYKAYKTIRYSPDGRESVVFYDMDGELIATAMSGTNDQGLNEYEMNMQSVIKASNGLYPSYVDIHLPEGCENSLELPTGFTYDIIDLISGEMTHQNFQGTSLTPPLEPGIYRIVGKSSNPSISYIPDIPIHYKLNYHNFTLNYYDKKGQIVATVSPQDFDDQNLPEVDISTQGRYYDFTMLNSNTNWELTQNNQQKFRMAIAPPSTGETQFTNITLILTHDNFVFEFGDGNSPAQPVEETQMVTDPVGSGGLIEEAALSQDYTTDGTTNYSSDRTGIVKGQTYTLEELDDFCSGTLVYASQVQTHRNNCIGFYTFDSYAMPNNMFCVSCKASNTCNRGPKDYDQKYKFKYEIKAITSSGPVHVTYLEFNAKELNGAWRIWINEEPHVPKYWQTEAPYQEQTAVIGTSISETASEIEVELIEVTRMEMTVGNNALVCAWVPVDESNFFDFADLRLAAVATTHTMGSPPHHKISNTFEYNSVGELLATESVDEGKSEFVYTQDGILRFSQSAQQRVDHKFSYTNYDHLVRPVEMGIVDESNPQRIKFQNHNGDITLLTGDLAVTDPSVLETIGSMSVGASYRMDETYINYDIPDPGFYTASGLSTSYKQEYVRGRISKVWNDNTTTWYSYFPDGRLDWMATKINGLGTKTIHYTYNKFGSAESIAYQKNSPSDYFEHKYLYDRVGNLKKALTRNSSTAAYNLESEYFYNIQGQLERVEVGGGLQGMDYVYNTLGMLKSINSPNLGAELRRYYMDPGRDGLNGLPTDIFGMSFDYFQGDYSRGGHKIISGTAQREYFDGKTAAIRWNTQSNPASTDQHLSYDYDYFKTGWLKSAFYTTVGPIGNTTVPPVTQTGPFGQYSVSNITYDKNGNIQTLVRKGKASIPNMDLLTYKYEPQKPNRLALVGDLASSTNYNTDIDHQGTWNALDPLTWNYVYDEEGRMIEDRQAKLKYRYNGYGLVEQVEKDHGAGYVAFVTFEYSDAGLRSRKIRHNAAGSPIEYTWYVRDASGAEVAKYLQNVGQAVQPAEYPLLADARLGVYDRQAGTRIYEFMDHLGNVRATFQRNGSGGINVGSYTDYYPFGSPLPGRNAISSPQYAHGYQGQFTEHDEETGLDAFELRMWDPRLARWTSTDPYGQFHSPYLGMGNNPVSGVDPDGGFWGMGPALSGAVVGALGGGIAGGIINGRDGVWQGALLGAAIGAGVGHYGFGAGKLPSFNLNISKEAGELIAGFTTNAIFSGLNGFNSATKKSDINPQVSIGQITAECIGCLPNTVTPQPPSIKDAVYQGQYDFLHHEITQAAFDLITLPFGVPVRIVKATNIIFKITEHALRRMAMRGITEAMVKKAIQKGMKYYDPKNNSINYILEGAFATGKDLLVGTDPITGVVKTTIRGSRLAKSRMIPIK